MSAKEHFTCVQLSENAGHGPYIALHVPLLAIKDDLGSPVLASVHNLSVMLVLIGGSSKVNKLNFDVFGPVPHTLLLWFLESLFIFIARIF